MTTAPLRSPRAAAARAVVAGLVAVGGLVVASFGQLFDQRGDRADTTEVIVAAVGAIVLVVAGVIAVRAAARAARIASEQRMAAAHGVLLSLVVSVIGYLVVILSALGSLEVNIGGLLLGGALTGVVVGIAAQQTFANFFAGIVLTAVRPFTVGEYIVIRSGPLGGEYEGDVTDMGLFYVRLNTRAGPVALPNAGILSAAIGPGARVPGQKPPPEQSTT